MPEGRALLPVRAPVGTPGLAMHQRPLRERMLEPDIATESLTLDPFVTQNFFALSEEDLIKIRWADRL